MGLDCSKFVINWKNDNDVTICRHDIIVNFFDVVLLPLSSLVTGPSFISVSSLELWPFTFIRDWSEIRKSETPSSEFCPISRDWGELGIPNLAGMSLMKRYKMLQNSRVTAFPVSELLWEDQQGELPPIQIRVKL